MKLHTQKTKAVQANCNDVSESQYRFSNTRNPRLGKKELYFWPTIVALIFFNTRLSGLVPRISAPVLFEFHANKEGSGKKKVRVVEVETVALQCSIVQEDVLCDRKTMYSKTGDVTLP